MSDVSIVESGQNNQSGLTIGQESKFGPVHLGQEGQSFRNREPFTTKDGFVIEVSQNSFGGTFIRAIPVDKEKSKLETLVKSGKGIQAQWAESNEKSGKVTVKGNWGNLDSPELNGQSYSAVYDKFGNPGIRYNLIRVTDIPSNSQKIFAVGAEFEGKADDWRVETAYFEVTPSLPQPEIGNSPPPQLAG
jgi:hypothetical protein